MSEAEGSGPQHLAQQTARTCIPAHIHALLTTVCAGGAATVCKVDLFWLVDGTWCQWPRNRKVVRSRWVPDVVWHGHLTAQPNELEEACEGRKLTNALRTDSLRHVETSMEQSQQATIQIARGVAGAEPWCTGKLQERRKVFV